MNNRISFFADKTSVSEAKRKASIHFNSLAKQNFNWSAVNEFNYVTSNGTYVFTRINKIQPNNIVIVGKWN